MLTINHTESGGTIIDGTAKGDGSAAILKTNGWRWSRLLGAWYVPYSRDVAPKSRIINGTAAALRAANFDVTVTIQSGIRDMTEVESDRAARQSDRVDALDAKAERLTDAAESAHGKAREMSNRYPWDSPSSSATTANVATAATSSAHTMPLTRPARPTAPPRRRRPRPTPPATPQTTGTTRSHRPPNRHPRGGPPQSTSQPRRTHPHHRDHGGRSPVHRDHRGRDRRLRRPAARQHRTPDNPDSVLEGCPRRSDRRGDSPLHPRRRHPR